MSLFFQVTAIFMVLFCIQLAIYAIHEFSEAGALPLVDNEYWHEVTEPFGPEGVYGTWLSYGLVLGSPRISRLRKVDRSEKVSTRRKGLRLHYASKGQNHLSRASRRAEYIELRWCRALTASTISEVKDFGRHRDGAMDRRCDWSGSHLL